jgi:pyocin large subunit-like protein
MFNRTLRLIILVAVALVAAVYFLDSGSRITSDDANSTRQSETYKSGDEAPSATAEWSSANGMSAHENAEHHWRKHGAEFGSKTVEEYEQAARDFVTHPPPGTEEKHEADGDTLYYNKQTNTFAVKRKDGAPRTMFKPDSGESYWERQ